ncbi:VOC family protein [Staphylococcus arlettae]|uniref:VOC family protein n=1 Tax=Staphylococcus arlettae TaxID=29378 RepID=UPI000DCCE38B|nr:VOC family protein [Staphylococcus arlettae]RBA04476.1 Catechol-2,3-dioxygenase [Staphylococcus arlettae]RBA05757.1 Catechol-2,3-dioxygenase [Staphylococcus arlettae]RBA08391.1 Catechol-2,3-dioxygenase [Staphylococcus arlettae]
MSENVKDYFINGITLNVRDKALMKWFYGEVLGLNIVNESYTEVRYEIGQHNHFIIFKQLAAGREPLQSEAGLFHLAIELSSYSELADLLVQLNQYHIPMNGGEHRFATSLYIEDPEHNGLEFYVANQNIKPISTNEKEHNHGIQPIDVSQLMTHVSQEQWQHIPDLAKIGYVNIKTIGINAVKQYYQDYFGMSAMIRETEDALYFENSNQQQHLVLNNWNSHIKRMNNEQTYGLACIDMHNPQTTHKQLQGPDGILYRFNQLKVK